MALDPQTLEKLRRALAMSKGGDTNATLLAMLIEVFGSMRTVEMKGEPGAPGVTPRKGIDYFTEKEKREFAQFVLQSIRMPADGKTPVPGVDYPTNAQIEDLVRRYVGQLHLPTPRVGVDYFTPAEIQGISAQISAGLQDVLVKLIEDRFKKLPVVETRLPSISLFGGGARSAGLLIRNGQEVYQDIQTIELITGFTVTRRPGYLGLEAAGSGGGGSSGLSFEIPTGTIDDSNADFTVSNEPLYVIANGLQLFSGAGYSYSGGTITLDNPLGTGGFIRSAYGAGVAFETPTGTVDDSNVDFTVSNEPKYVIVNGAVYFDGAGYSYSGGTITLNAPVGTGGFIRSAY